jgi:hypothetical protein
VDLRQDTSGVKGNGQPIVPNPNDQYFSMVTVTPGTPIGALWDDFRAHVGAQPWASTVTASVFAGAYTRGQIQSQVLKSSEVIDQLYVQSGSSPQIWAVYTPSLGSLDIYAPTAMGLANSSHRFRVGSTTVRYNKL